MRTIRAACAVGSALIFLTGCSGASRQQQFDQSLRQATVELNQGRLQEADGALAAAAQHASGKPQSRKVEDLRHLRTGTEQYISGNVAGALAAWRQIEDPSLRRQILAQAGESPEGARQ